MSAPGPTRRQLPPALVVFVIVVCVALLVGLISFIIPISLAAQAYLLVVIVLGFRYSPPVVRWFSCMPIPHRVVFILITGAMIVGHFTLETRRYFPFVAWEIFPVVREDNPVVCREFIATTASGKNVRLLVEQLFPSIIQFNPPKKNDSPAMTHLVQAMAKVYNRHHPGDPARRVDLMRMAVDLHPSENNSSFSSCKLLKRYDVSSAPSN